MYEFDILAVGDGARSGDAIAIRFTRPDTGTSAVVVIDAGFADSGDALVGHVNTYYGTGVVDLAILTHPDGDHIGGMGAVLRQLSVGTLWVHDLGRHGGSGLPAADAVDDLISVAHERGTEVLEPFSGATAFGGCLTVLGPDEVWYEELVGEQQLQKATAASGAAYSRMLAAVRRGAQRVLSVLPLEVPFDDAGGTSPRNHTSIILALQVSEQLALFTGDAGVAAIDRAWDWMIQSGSDPTPQFVQLPHHGSRHNGSSALLNRVLGQPGQPESKTAFVSVTREDPDHPSPRIVNAYKRRGYRVYQTAGTNLRHHSSDAPNRGWSPATPLEALDESGEDE